MAIAHRRAAACAAVVLSACLLAPAVRADDTASPAAGDEGNAALVTPEVAPTSDTTQEPRAREFVFMLGGDAADDLRGFRASLYEGKWFMPGKEDVRRCILERESNANYRSTSGVYHGAYQMSTALAHGAAWMMQKEVRKEFGDEGLRIVQQLRERPVHTWNRYWQDRAFWTIWRGGEGKRHWHGGC